MQNDIDVWLGRLAKTPPDRSLDRIEAQVWDSIDAAASLRWWSATPYPLQAALTTGALVIGLVFGFVVAPPNQAPEPQHLFVEQVDLPGA